MTSKEKKKKKSRNVVGKGQLRVYQVKEFMVIYIIALNTSHVP